jgi:DNA-binding response OmpR family regulator
MTASPELAVSPSTCCRVLVVEDNMDAAQALALSLADHRHDVETTRNGTEALVVASRFRPHVVLIDVGLPGLDGLYVARQLRSAFASRLLIIATTGRSSPQDRQLSLDAGCDFHLVKPLDFQTVHGILDDWKQTGGCNN